MTEISASPKTKNRSKQQPQRTPVMTLMQKHGVSSLAVLSDEDLRKVNALSPAEQEAMYAEELLAGLEGTARKVGKEEIRNRVLKRMGLDV